VAEDWDDWGPFYTPMYNQLVGLDGSTVEMCQSLNANPAAQRVCGAPELTTFPGGLRLDVENNWMRDYPTAYVIPLGPGQRSDPEANRLVRWLLTNGIEVSQLSKSITPRRADLRGRLVCRLDGPGAPRARRDGARNRRRRLRQDQHALRAAANTVGTARVTVYAMNPLYRADPERGWPSISTAAYWSDQ
jgi:hypothetical protein